MANSEYSLSVAGGTPLNLSLTDPNGSNSLSVVDGVKLSISLSGAAGPTGPIGPAGAAGPAGDSGTETLQWTTSGDYRTLTGYYVDGVTSTVRLAEFVGDQLRLTLATFNPTMTASVSPSAILNWDVAATGFTVAVNNPADVTTQYISAAASITVATGSVSALGLFATGGPSPSPAGGVDWSQTFTVAGSSYIRSTSTTIAGGSASGTVAFNFTTDSTTAVYSGSTASFSVEWNTPTLAASSAALTGQTFLGSYSSVAYTVTVTGITNSANYTVTPTPTGGTTSGETKSGGTLNFTTLLHKDNANAARTVSVSATFTRPVAVTGTSYPITPSAVVTSSPTAAGFTYPSLWVFTAGTGTVPNSANYVDGFVFRTGVTVLADQTKTLAGTITNDTGSAKCLWFAVKKIATQPMVFQTGSSSSLLVSVTPTIVDPVNLQPTSPLAGYSAVPYILYGITLQNGNTYVSIT
jgi:hypothetical protein